MTKKVEEHKLSKRVRNVNQTTQIALYIESMNMCPMCDGRLTELDDENNIIIHLAEVAHIIALGTEKAARTDSTLTNEQINSFNNLLVLCANCHTKIDKNPHQYTDGYLRNIKDIHRQKMLKLTAQPMMEIGFQEISTVIRAIASGKHTSISNPDFRLITPQDKMDKNSFSTEVRVLILQGVSRATEVNSCIEKCNQLDDVTATNLLNKFKEAYKKYKQAETSSDAIFYQLVGLPINKTNINDAKIYAASIALTSYLFESCEIFEK